MKKRNLLLQVKIISEVAVRELDSAKFFNDVDYSKSDSTETK
jgi:hypothetical protein